MEGEWVDQITDDWPNVMNVINGSRESYGDDMGAFLCFMGVRLLEMRRILHPKGSIYLHCDPTASHYLKELMDAIFGRKNFRNEIIWHYEGPQRPSRRNFARKHETILRYSKTERFYGNTRNKHVVTQRTTGSTRMAATTTTFPEETTQTRASQSLRLREEYGGQAKVQSE